MSATDFSVVDFLLHNLKNIVDLKKFLGGDILNKTIPAVSIIIPMYNTEKYIGECLDSIFAQTFDDYEIIVVDDCSTDNSCAVVENYIQTHREGGVLIG